MAKIYDAMRRAEEERRRLASLAAPPEAEGLWEDSSAVAPVRTSAPFWKRWLRLVLPSKHGSSSFYLPSCVSVKNSMPPKWCALMPF